MLPIVRHRFVAPTVFEPWSDLRREIDRLFESNLTGTELGSNAQSQYVPAMDIEESSERIRLTLEVPGVSPEDLHITVENNVLTVSGEKRFRRESDGDRRGSQLVERRYGRFQRSVMLPDSVDADAIAAHFENGVLTVELPRSARSRRRTISIGLGADQHRHDHRQNGRTQIGSTEAEAAGESRTSAATEDQRERQLA